MINLNDVIISRSKLEEATYLETLRAEIEHGGKYVVVSTAWLEGRR